MQILYLKLKITTKMNAKNMQLVDKRVNQTSVIIPHTETFFTSKQKIRKESLKKFFTKLHKTQKQNKTKQ